MLHDFLTEEREAILEIARSGSREVQKGRTVSTGMDEGWGLFYDELTELMRENEPFSFHNELGHHTAGATQRGKEYFQLGYSLSEVVHSYGFLCQAITSHATEMGTVISTREFQQLNLSLDTAIAEAVTEFDKWSKDHIDEQEVRRLGHLAHELRNGIHNVMITLEMIKSGAVGAQSSTSHVLDKNLQRMIGLIDGAMTEVRMRSEPEVHLIPSRLFDLMHEVGVTAGYEARARNITLEMKGSYGIESNVDRQLYVAALANLVHNALKYTKPGSDVTVCLQTVGENTVTEVEDECGGLSVNVPEDLFQERTQQHEDKSGLGLGLGIARKAVEQMNGTLTVINLPGKGCRFSITLPTSV